MRRSSRMLPIVAPGGRSICATANRPLRNPAKSFTVSTMAPPLPEEEASERDHVDALALPAEPVRHRVRVLGDDLELRVEVVVGAGGHRLAGLEAGERARGGPARGLGVGLDHRVLPVREAHLRRAKLVPTLEEEAPGRALAAGRVERVRVEQEEGAEAL